MNNPIVERSHQEQISCPNCDETQEAIIRLYAGDPWPTYIHDCVGCGYTITESEWNLVNTARGE